MAVCAPWSALTRYKYKIKLTPGSMKKGKAARACVGAFLATPVDEEGEDVGKMSPREKELLKSLKGAFPIVVSVLMVDEEIIPCIWPKSVKIVGAKVDMLKWERKAGILRRKGRNSLRKTIRSIE